MNGYPENPLLSSALVASLRTGKPRLELSDWQRKKSTWIYGLFDSNGKCHYTGQTTNPENRAKCFRYSHPSYTMKTIRFCPIYAGARLETQIMAAYKRRGESEINKQKGGKCGRWRGKFIYYAKENIYFSSHLEASEYLRVSPPMIKNYITQKTPNEIGLSYVY